MWTHQFSMQTEVSVEALWKPLADVANWRQIDEQIEKIEIDEQPQVGTIFHLKPKGGPRLKLRIDIMDPPQTYADTCYLPLAKMMTTHALRPSTEGTEISVQIVISGPLSFLWQRLVGKKHADGLLQQTRRLIEVASSAG